LLVSTEDWFLFLVGQPSLLVFMMSVPALSDIPRDQHCPIAAVVTKQRMNVD